MESAREVEAVREAEEEEGPRRKKALDAVTVCLRRAEQIPEVDRSDMEALRAARYRELWDYAWGGEDGIFGSFEDPTPIGPKRFTDDPSSGCPRKTLQIFSVKIARIIGDLQWPLDVYGVVAARDCIDYNRNVIFDRTMENCQTLTEEHPYLALRGPTRAIVLVDPVVFEVDLKVRGNTESSSEDKHLSYLAVEYMNWRSLRCSLLCNRAYTSKLSTVELTFGHIISSVEATIDVEVISGSSLSHGFHGLFIARTASIDEMVLLLDSGNDLVPVAENGMVELSRCVVSVELKGELEVLVEVAENNGGKFVQANASFTPKECGRSSDTLDVGFCRMKVTVAWSLFSLVPKQLSSQRI